MIDVDHFKPFNDMYGHLVGDDCLKTIGHSLQKLAHGPRDVAARFGGEEFAMILPNAHSDTAYLVAEEIRGMLAQLAIPHDGNSPPVVTVSIGTATMTAFDRHRSATEIVRRADEALYAAKAAGRDCSIVWQPQEASEDSSAA